MWATCSASREWGWRFSKGGGRRRFTPGALSETSALYWAGRGQTERILMLQVIDNQWKDHLLSMDELKQGIGLRAQGQKDPLVEYKRESFDYFTAMMDRIEDETVRY